MGLRACTRIVAAVSPILCFSVPICGSAHLNRVKELEKERRSQIHSIRTAEAQELGKTVAQEMEKKRKLAELKRMQARAKAAERVSAAGDDSDSEDEELAKLQAKAPVVAKKNSDDEDADEEARKKRQRLAAQRRRGGRMGI